MSRKHKYRKKHKNSKLLYLLLILCVIGMLGSCMKSDSGDSSDSGNLVKVETRQGEENDYGDSAWQEPQESQDELVIETETASNPASASKGDSNAGTDQSRQSKDSTFQIYFIDVGQGDAALIQCDGESMLIDGGNADHSRTMYAFMKAKNVTKLKFVIATHPDADHIGGLAGALNYATVGKAFCSVKSHDTETFQTLKKYLARQNISLQVPTQGQTLALGSAKITILSGPYTEDDSNNNSIVCRIVYGKTSFLFTGDAETEEEESVMASGYTLKSTVLKVAHHGSNSSTGKAFLREVSPTYAVIPVGEDNDYGHPTQNTLDRLNAAGAKVYRTDLQGTILCKSNGTKVTFTLEKGTNADTLTKEPSDSGDAVTKNNNGGSGSSETTYVLNTGSMKFHYPGCAAVKAMSGKNKKTYTGSRDTLLEKGYSPCGICDP